MHLGDGAHPVVRAKAHLEEGKFDEALRLSKRAISSAQRSAETWAESIALRDRNAELSEDRRILLRIGINIGDVIADGDDIYGAGVNVAARMQELADPGGICISRTVFTHVKGKLDLNFEPLGQRVVKNIAEPVSVYRVVLDDV